MPTFPEPSVCVQSASASDYKGMPTGSQVTLGYNSARINEATGNFQAAATEYKNILEAFPGKDPLCLLLNSILGPALAGTSLCSLSGCQCVFIDQICLWESIYIFPSVSAEYSDCALRMACLAGRRGDYPEARSWIERAMKYRSGQRDAQSLQGKALVAACSD